MGGTQSGPCGCNGSCNCNTAKRIRVYTPGKPIQITWEEYSKEWDGLCDGALAVGVPYCVVDGPCPGWYIPTDASQGQASDLVLTRAAFGGEGSPFIWDEETCTFSLDLDGDDICDFAEEDNDTPITGNENMLYCEGGSLKKRNFEGAVGDQVLLLLDQDEFADAVFELIAASADSQVVGGRSYWVELPSGPGPIAGTGGNYGADYHVLGGWVSDTDPLYVAGGPFVLDEIATSKDGKYQMTTRAHVRPRDAGDAITSVNFAYAIYNPDGTLQGVRPAELRNTDINLTDANVYNFSRVEAIGAGEKIQPLIYAETANGGPVEVRYVRHAFAKTLS